MIEVKEARMLGTAKYDVSTEVIIIVNPEALNFTSNKSHLLLKVLCLFSNSSAWGIFFWMTPTAQKVLSKMIAVDLQNFSIQEVEIGF